MSSTSFQYYNFTFQFKEKRDDLELIRDLKEKIKLHELQVNIVYFTHYIWITSKTHKVGELQFHWIFH